MSLAQTLDDGILHENGRIREVGNICMCLYGIATYRYKALTQICI